MVEPAAVQINRVGYKTSQAWRMTDQEGEETRIEVDTNIVRISDGRFVDIGGKSSLLLSGHPIPHERKS
jgi:hypothetical protein